VKVLIAIDAPGFGMGWGRREQSERTSIADMLKLLASRIEFGQCEGSLTGNGGARLHWKIEPSPPAPAKNAGGEAA
jgi:hypothetical protein